MEINWDVIKGKWAQFKGEARIQWGKLTDNDWEQIGGQKDRLIGKLQETYGWGREEAESRVNEFFKDKK